MGAVHFSIDTELVCFFRERLPLETFVETGTYRGESLARVRPLFKQLFSVEFSPQYFHEASARFANDSAVEIRQGDSSEFLAELSEWLRERPSIFWLDAHWCEDEGTAGKGSQCPLIAELYAIEKLHPQSVVLVDDFRFFLSPPNSPHEISQWPGLDEVLAALTALGPDHRLMVFNDVGVFYPATLREPLREYARVEGVDWLRVLHQSREYGEILRQAKEKEERLQEKDRAIEEKQGEIERLAEALGRSREEVHESHCHWQQEAAQARRLEAVAAERAHALENLTESIQTLRAAHEAEMERSEGRFSAQQSRLVSLEERNAELTGIVASQAETIHHLRNRNVLRRAVGWSRRKFQAGRSRIQHHQEAAKAFFRPRLGNLRQHPPRSLSVPTRYHQIPRRPNWPTISVVTPSFQQADFIRRTLDSVLDQDYPALEYVVQDGGSTDGTAEILREYEERLHRWISRPDDGQSNAINCGFSKTSGEIMAWLNSDDLLMPGALHYVADFFLRNPHVDVVYGHRILIDEYDREIGRWVLPPHDEEVLSWADFVPQETLFWRRRIWDRVGGRVDESFQFAMDWDLLLRFQEAGAQMVRLPRFLGAFRVHTRQKTSADITETGWNEMGRLRARCHGRKVAEDEIFSKIRPYLAFHIVLTKLFRAGILRY